MARDDDTPTRVRWARLRFSIIGPLLASPAEGGDLKRRIEELALRSWKHPQTGEAIRVSFKTIERWFYAARDQSDPIAALARKVHASPGGLARSTLRPLAENGLVELSGGSARSTGRWRPVDGHVTAVELKLSKWRSALRQADNIAFAADRSWVVLDSARARKAVAAVDHFRAFGVGLAVVGPESPLRVVVRPAGRRPERWLRALMAECAWQRAESDALAHLGVF